MISGSFIVTVGLLFISINQLGATFGRLVFLYFKVRTLFFLVRFLFTDSFV